MAVWHEAISEVDVRSAPCRGHILRRRQQRRVPLADRCLEMYRIMVRTRAMEERMIKMSKSGEGYFWIGGPGEEAFNACLGLQVKKGQGPDFDYLHLHYRNSATLVAMGMPLIDGIRQMAMTAPIRTSMGRNFAGHFARTRLERRPGHLGHRGAVRDGAGHGPGAKAARRRRHHHRHRRRRRHGRGRFRLLPDLEHAGPGNELPVLIIVTNNGWGISTPPCSQHRRTHHRPRQGVRHSRRSRRRQRSRRQLARRRAGAMDYCRPSAPVHARGDGIAAFTAIRPRAGRRVDEPDCMDAVREAVARRRRRDAGRDETGPRGSEDGGRQRRRPGDARQPKPRRTS